MRVHEQERSGIDLLTSKITSLSTLAASTSNSITSDLQVETPLATLYGLLSKVSVMLDSVLEYVRAVAAGELEGNERVGRALMETVGVVPAGSAASGKGQAGETKGFEEDFNAHLADVLMVSCTFSPLLLRDCITNSCSLHSQVSYLANLVTVQTEISSRLNLLV